MHPEKQREVHDGNGLCPCVFFLNGIRDRPEPGEIRQDMTRNGGYWRREWWPATDGLAHAEGIKGMHAAQWRVCTPFLWVLYCGCGATGVLQTGKGGGI